MRLFTDDGNWTDAASALANQLGDAIRPILETAVAKGYDVRDVELIASHTAFDVAVETILLRRINQRKEVLTKKLLVDR